MVRLLDFWEKRELRYAEGRERVLLVGGEGGLERERVASIVEERLEEMKDKGNGGGLKGMEGRGRVG